MTRRNGITMIAMTECFCFQHFAICLASCHVPFALPLAVGYVPCLFLIALTIAICLVACHLPCVLPCLLHGSCHLPCLLITRSYGFVHRTNIRRPQAETEAECEAQDTKRDEIVSTLVDYSELLLTLYILQHMISFSARFSCSSSVSRVLFRRPSCFLLSSFVPPSTSIVLCSTLLYLP